MPTRRDAFAVLKPVICVVSLLNLLAAAGHSQANMNDVHIVPRVMASGGPKSVAREALSHVIKTDVKLVLVPVSVTDPNQRLVTGLRAENFEVFEGKKPQEIRHFSSEDVPASIGIILDSSGSMVNKMERVRDAVNQFC